MGTVRTDEFRRDAVRILDGLVDFSVLDRKLLTDSSTFSRKIQCGSVDTPCEVFWLA